MKMKKLIAAMLALVMVVGLLPTAFADNSVIVYGETGKTYEEVVELYGDTVGNEWKWLLENRDSRHADVYLWYCESGNINGAHNFWFLCSPSSAAFYNSSPFDNAPHYTDETTHQMALDQLKENSEAMYRYLTVGDISLKEAKGETANPAPTPAPVQTAEPAQDDKQPNLANPAVTNPTPDTTPAVDITFVDVNEGDWYYEAVMALAHTGILNGKGNGIFDPNANITVGEMAALICRIDQYANPVAFVPGEKLSTENYGERTFDQPTSWAHEYIMGVRRAGMSAANWYNYPNWDPEAFAEPVTRGEAMHIAVAFASRMTRYSDFRSASRTWAGFRSVEGYAVPGKEFIPDIYKSVHTPTCGCSDYRQTEHDWGLDVIREAYSLNIVHGVDSEHNANGHGLLTRAEFCQMLYNMGIKDGNTVNNPYAVPDIEYVIPKTLDELMALWK